MNLTENVTTLAELRAFVEQCDRLGIADTATVHARTGFGFSAAGPPLKSLTVRNERPVCTCDWHDLSNGGPNNPACPIHGREAPSATSDPYDYPGIPPWAGPKARR